MMDFDQIVVKESPGLCRCCLSEGCYKDLGTEYAWMSDTEVYADMLLECFDISITQHNEGPNGPNRLICEVCITRLRDACNFKKQVMESEKKFIDMVGRGEFRPKVLIYQGQMKSEEQVDEVQDEPEVEYLDDEMTFGDGDITKDEPGESSTYEDLTVSTLPVKAKRGRPRKNVAAANSEKKAKVPKTEEKPRSSKAVAKGVEIKKEKRTSYFEKLCSIRRNVTIVLRYGNVLPFNWTTKGFRCFYCSKQMRDCEILKAHTISRHASVDYNTFIPKRIITKDIPVKVDVTNFSCKECPEIILTNLDDLITHIAGIHGEPYDFSTGVCLFPFVLKTDLMSCVICEESYDNFTCMIGHMYKRHITHVFMCQKCGLSFIDQARLNRHMHGSHMDHQCTICGKNFVAFHKLDKHKKLIHGLVKSFSCSLCGEIFETNYQMKVHMGKVHNVQQYRLKCEHCPKICTTKGAMVLHVQSLHSEFKFECDLCDYKTGIKWMLKLHRRIHFGEKDYSCTICDRRFGRSSNLRAHMKVHTGSSGRVCRLCRRGFTDFEALNQHELERHYYNS